MLDAILKYQETDALLKKIENELSGSEDRKKAIVAKKFLESVEENLEKLDNRAAELAAAFEAASEKQTKLKEQEAEFGRAIDTLEDETEAQYLLKKAEELLAKIKKHEEETAKIAADIQSVMKDYHALRNNTKAMQAQYSECGKKYNQLIASKKDERESIEKQLEQLKKNVEPSVMERYLKKRSEKIFPVLFEARGEVCGACNMQLPLSELNKLKNGEIIECDQCRRLLYKPQDK